jgi:ribonuclease HI
VRLLVVPHGPLEEITGILPDGRFQVVSLFVRRLCFCLHERQLIEVNQSPVKSRRLVVPSCEVNPVHPLPHLWGARNADPVINPMALHRRRGGHVCQIGSSQTVPGRGTPVRAAGLIGSHTTTGPAMASKGMTATVNTPNTRLAHMAVIAGVKSIPPGSEVKIVTDSTDVISVAARRHPKLQHRDLVLALGAELAQRRAPVPHVDGHRGDPEHARIDRLASAATHGWLECRQVKR